jgi:hypothetical protein
VVRVRLFRPPTAEFAPTTDFAPTAEFARDTIDRGGNGGFLNVDDICDCCVGCTVDGYEVDDRTGGCGGTPVGFGFIFGCSSFHVIVYTGLRKKSITFCRNGSFN